MLASTVFLVLTILAAKKPKKGHSLARAKRSYDAWERSRGFRYSSK